jgi:hypothetical protein
MVASVVYIRICILNLKVLYLHINLKIDKYMETLDPECKKTKIKNINQGTYFKLKPTTTAPVWVRGEYERSLGKYSCFKFDDTNHEKFMKGSQDVYINFTF